MVQIPIGHMEGNYFCDEHTLADLKRDYCIAFRYSETGWCDHFCGESERVA